MVGWIAFFILLVVVIVVVAIGIVFAAAVTIAFMPFISMCYTDPQQLEKDKKEHPLKHMWYDFCGRLMS